jgi:hypothetical protein
MMIDRCSNKVAITSQDRLQPIDKWEDYPIKVLNIAPLIMVTLLTVSSFFSTFGCFLRDGRSSSGDLPSLSSLWMASRCEWLSPCQMAAPPGIYSWRSFGCKERGGLNQPPEWARSAGLGRPAQVHPSPVRSPIRSRGSSGGYAFCPLHLHYFDDVILASEPTPGVGQAGRPKPTGPVHPSPVRSPLQSRGSSGDYAFCPLHLHYFDDVILTSNMDLCMKSGLLCFNPQRYSFVALRSLPPLEVISSSLWTRTRLRKYSFELVVNPSFMSKFSYTNTTLPNACI